MPERTLRPADPDQAERLHTFAHDIKNRLGSLWEALRLMRSGTQAGPDTEELISFAERGYFHAQRDLEDLLDDLGVERGITADRIPFDLMESLKEALTNEAYRLRKKGQRVEVKAPDSRKVTGDARWTTQILQALISNASKFSPRDAVITVEVASEPGASTVRVIDPGCGLPAEDLPNLFKRYVILTSRSTDSEPQSRGTLARAQQWALAQNGGLQAASAGPGHGCTMTLRLPAP